MSRTRATIIGLAMLAIIWPGDPGTAAQSEDRAATATFVEGTSRLLGEVAAGTTIEDGIVRTRDNVLATVERTSDPRVSGRAVIILDIDTHPTDAGPLTVTQIRYGSMRIENEAGAWEGRFTGRLTERGFTQTYWLEGRGAFEGLTDVVTAGGNGPVWQSQGLIYPGEPPTMGERPLFPVDAPEREVPSA